MSTNLTVNIDTIIFIVKESKEGSFNIPSTTAKVYSKDGKLLESYQNRISLKGKHGTHSLQVRTMNNGKVLRVECSPYAFLYGQNVFTASDLNSVVIRILRRVCKKFGFRITRQRLQRWINGGIELRRVDLFVNFDVALESEATKILKQVYRQLVKLPCSMQKHGSSVYLHKKDLTFCFYAKGPQMRSLPSYKKIPEHRVKLLKVCEPILRLEFRLLAGELLKRDLSQLSSWTQRIAERTYWRYFRNKLKLFSITSGTVTKEELDKYPRGLRTALALHKAGVDLTDVYSARTLQRHRGEFRKNGIDIRCPNQPEGTVVSLTEVLSLSNAISEIPGWMIEAGIAQLLRSYMGHGLGIFLVMARLCG